MANRPTIRGYERLYDAYMLHETWDRYPVHAVGMAVFFKNEGENEATISIEESNDGVSWSPVLFSTPVSSGNISYTLQPLANLGILFISSCQFVRINTDPSIPEGLYVWTVQYPPVGERMGDIPYMDLGSGDDNGPGEDYEHEEEGGEEDPPFL